MVLEPDNVPKYPVKLKEPNAALVEVPVTTKFPLVAVATTSSPATGTTPSTHAPVVFQLPPASDMVLVAIFFFDWFLRF